VTDPLDDFERTDVTHLGQTRVVHRKGSGPGVIVMAEMPGITPDVADFARKVADIGCTVAMPSLFGTDGRPLSTAALLSTMPRACVSREFHALAVDEASPVTRWLRALAADLHRTCGGPGVGAVGMCFTGGFALAMMVDDSVVAPVLSQPSLPLPLGARRAAALGVSAADLETVRRRVEQGCPVLGLRFTNDRFVGNRFDTLRRELGDGFIAVELDSSPGNPHGFETSAHSVLTTEVVDEPGHPAAEAVQTVLDFLRRRLGLPAAPGDGPT
jgi:dienelactone hydrolase